MSPLSKARICPQNPNLTRCGAAQTRAKQALFSFALFAPLREGIFGEIFSQSRPDGSGKIPVVSQGIGPGEATDQCGRRTPASLPAWRDKLPDSGKSFLAKA